MVAATDGLSAVIVNYRRPDLLVEAVRALSASQRRPDEIVIVDVDPVEPPGLESWPEVKLVTLDDNPGYAAACNRGAAQARSEWLLFMNADVFVSPSAVGGVLGEAAVDPAIGIATCRLVRPDGELDHACHRGIPTAMDSLIYKARLDRLRPTSRRLGHYRLTWLDPAETHDIEACSGAFLLIRRDAFEAVGGWDEHYWFYAEDLDLCLRATQAGWRVRYVGTETATHVKGGSSRLHDEPHELTAEERAARRRVHVATVDAHQRFYQEHLEDGTSRPLRPMVMAMFAAQRYMAKRS